jgi:type IV pilus assembly protein PilA
MSLAAAAKTAVAETFLNSGAAPVNRTEAGMIDTAGDGSETQGKYVSSVQIQNGTIIITYGNEANAQIDAETLEITPYETADLSVVWRCGEANAPTGAPNTMGTSGMVNAATYTAGGTIVSNAKSQYLPAACRPAP